MRDCLFLVADKNMQAAFEGFLTRPNVHQSLGCGAFEFDPRLDLVVAAGDNDPGLYTRGHELLRPYQGSHRRAIVVLDADWDGSPGAQVIIEHLTGQILSTGWPEESVRVVVIDPELENWIWQRNEHVARGLGFQRLEALMADPDFREAWPEGQTKPASPKESLELLLCKQRIPRSSAIYKRITAQVSIKHCEDAAFHSLIEALRSWFPPDAVG